MKGKRKNWSEKITKEVKKKKNFPEIKAMFSDHKGTAQQTGVGGGGTSTECWLHDHSQK